MASVAGAAFASAAFAKTGVGAASLRKRKISHEGEKGGERYPHQHSVSALIETVNASCSNVDKLLAHTMGIEPLLKCAFLDTVDTRL